MHADKFLEIKKQILIEIKKWDNIIIHRHERPDPDALGSQNGLAELIQTSFPKKQFIPREKILLRWLIWGK